MWIGSGTGETSVAGSAVVLLSTLSAGADLLRPFTILRTRLLLWYRSDQNTASEGPFGTYGRMIVTDAASAIGITAIPDPSGITGEPEADWYVWQAVEDKVDVVTTATGLDIGYNDSNEYIIDSKAMRKVGPDDDVVGVFSQENGVGALVGVNGRTLIQLH